MDRVYPFDPLQSLLDKKAGFSLAASLSLLGSAFQLFSYQVSPLGFAVEIGSLEKPSQEWIAEWFRQASLLMRSRWPLPVEMSLENLKLFWKEKGQHLRARQIKGSATLLSVLVFPGLIEPFSGDRRELSSLPFDLLVPTSCEKILRDIKGHRETIWSVQGRVAPTSEARKILSSLKQEKEVPSPFLKPSSMKQLLHLQSLWLEELAYDPTLEISLSRFAISTRKLGWSWSRQRVDDPLASFVPLWLESEYDRLDFFQIGSKERIAESLSFLLRIIYKMVKLLNLEIHAALHRNAGKALPWLEIFEDCPFPLSLVEEEAEDHLFWQMSVCSKKRTWWPLAQIDLLAIDAKRWQIEANPVISFYRWAVAAES